MFKGGLIVPSRMVFLMWLTFTVQRFLGFDLSFLGIWPRKLIGLIGVITAPFVHGDYTHIISNTVPLLVLAGTLFFFYERIAPKVFAACYFITNFLVWLMGRGDSVHIGASGLIYAIAAFLIFYGFFSRNFKSLVISLVIIFFYAGMFYGILPDQPKVSWESHLFGAIVGGVTAYAIGRKK